MAPPISPIRRAFYMTAIFAGPGFLILFLISAFLGALQPTPGAKELLREHEPKSLVISMNASGTRENVTMQRSYLLVPASFRERSMFVVSRDELEQLTVSSSSQFSFYLWAFAVTAAVALTVFVSTPTLWQLYRPRPDLVDYSGLSEEDDDDSEDHAQL